MTDPTEYPLVTLVLFTYNQEKFIEAAIRSALSQDYSPLEIIISDDCSTDGTYKVAEECIASYPGPHRLVVRRNTHNLGLANHINLLLGMSAGEFVCWAAGDDVSLERKVSTLVEPMLRDSQIAGTHSYVNEIDESGRFLRVRMPCVPAVIDSPGQVIEGEIEIISQSHAFRKSVWERFGEIQSSVTNESAVMAFREACCGRILLVTEVLTDYRVGVGVSTQRGRTVHELSVAEPVKYSRWWSSSYRQICLDKNKVNLPSSLDKLIESKSRAFDDRLAISEHAWQWRLLFSNVLTSQFGALLKAFIRRNAPVAFLTIIYRSKGWL